MDFDFNKDYVLSLTKNLLKTDSPSGFTKNAASLLKKYACQLGYEMTITNKGNCIISVAGRDTSKTVGVSAHIDTLGLMVRSIKPDGMLAVTAVGSPILPTLDAEYCAIYTRNGARYTGTILSTSPSTHVYDDSGDKPRKDKTLEVRIDEVVRNADDVKKLGISAGDYICIDPKTEITESGFIKSRFLDDKLSVGIVFGVLLYMKEKKLTPAYNTKFIFTVYEEVGHGLSPLPSDVSELLSVDMGCIGEDLSCTEYDVSICAKDSSGPYDYALTTKLIEAAKCHSISYAIDIYPHYSSDVSAARFGGADIAGALIGPGVHASHGMERSHYEAVLNTMKLLAVYLGI